MKYLSLFLLLFFIPVYSFAVELVGECFATDDAYYKLVYTKSSKEKNGIDHKLFVSNKNNNDKFTLYNDKIELNDDNSIKELVFINYNNKNDKISINSLKPKAITVNRAVKPVKQIDCFTFLSTYDRFIDENGQSYSIYTKGKNFMEEKFKNSSFTPSFDCKNAESNMEKAICNNNEVSYLDNLFHSMNKCYEKNVLKRVKNQDVYKAYLDGMANDFLSYRNKSYKSNGETFSAKELEQVKKAYMLGIIFTPMTISAYNGDLYILGQKLFMSYYMLTTQGITYKDSFIQKGLGFDYALLHIYLGYYDEIMYYYAGVYDNMNKRLPHLFYYTVYLQEKYGLIDSEGNCKCK